MNLGVVLLVANGCRRRGLLYFHPTKIVISTGALIHLSGNTPQVFQLRVRKGNLTQKDKSEALKVARERVRSSMRQKQGLKARRVKKMFDFIDEYLEQESKRVSDYNKKGHITAETFKCEEASYDSAEEVLS